MMLVGRCSNKGAFMDGNETAHPNLVAIGKEIVKKCKVEGFVHNPKGKRHLEDIASDYFEDLVLRSFFQQSKTNLSMFVMHDLFHDLAQSVVGEMCFILESENQKIPQKVQHSSVCYKELPDSSGDLMHMRKLLSLPQGTKDLVNLRHLNLSGCWHLTSMPPSFGRLTSLQRLHRFFTGNEAGSRISELKDINELRATLCIDRIEDIINIEDAKEASLKRKQYIHKLLLRWSRSRRVRDAIDEELLECLKPHTHLRKLTIDVFPGAKFPN
ncbi:hypothetical protein GH714_017287 [Hevea brasiliensis]|uniref:Uncharacterized protein n=1 Tax=Hevea brasiliensis TaxID=3981 RepID=A0A6A6NCR9_HEVBR|nr:hypothetical protein GH714_017287 [Hevea brasiliensis]